MLIPPLLSNLPGDTVVGVRAGDDVLYGWGRFDDRIQTVVSESYFTGGFTG